ncbi:V-type proton ATPase subunit S1-like [Pelobates fuscus]|uniref:V-type proton ATPase subunit S1-like n=1 Tax=Pelobates fuscus TaxID=191477 RepID=UPI002FE49CA5
MYPFSGFLPCFLFVLCPGVLAVSHVPVLLWSSESYVWNSASATHKGHVTSNDELHRLLQSAITSTPTNLVLFLQDTLSMDDFTYYSSTYGNESPLRNIQIIMESSPSSLVLPAVDWKTVDGLQGHLQTQDDWNELRINSFDTPVELDKDRPNLFIVNLQPIPRSSEMNKAEAFSGNDEYIGNLTRELSERGVPFTAIYSGIRPSKVFKSLDTAPNLSRQLLSTGSAEKYPPLNVTNGTTTCILFYATTFTVTVNNTKLIDLTNATFVSQSVNTSSSECSDSNTTLSLFYTSPATGLDNLEIRFFMTNRFYTGSARKWFKIQSIMIIPNQQMEFNATFDTTYASAPEEYGYHCQQVGSSRLYPETFVPANSAANNWAIYLYEFQIQGFNIKNNLFSYASDCSTFFTPAIWMGLVSTIILLWILAYGIFMIMQLSTNDKFDDSKSQALSVPQTD